MTQLLLELDYHIERTLKSGLKSYMGASAS